LTVIWNINTNKQHNAERDHSVAEHVLRAHKFRAAGEREGALMALDNNDALQSLCTRDLNQEPAGRDPATKDADLGIYQTSTEWLPYRNSRLVLGFR